MFREVRSFVSARRILLRRHSAKTLNFLTMRSPSAVSGSFRPKSRNRSVKSTTRTANVTWPQLALTSKSFNGHPPDDDFSGKPRKNSDHSAKDSPFA